MWVVIVIGILLALAVYTFFGIYMIRPEALNLRPFARKWTKHEKAQGRKLITETTAASPNDLFPISHTLAGMLRDEEIVFWEESLEFCGNVDVNDLHAKLKEKGIGVVEDGNFLKIYNIKSSDDKKWTWPFINLRGYEIDGDKLIIKDYPTLQLTDIFPLKTNLLERIPICVPNDPDAVLISSEGQTWEDRCVSTTGKYTFSTECKNLEGDMDPKYLRTGWVINLDRQPERWGKTKETLEDIGIEAIRWSATDAKHQDFIEKYNKLEGDKLSIGEFACSTSHHALWEHLYELNVPYALIFEDDIQIPESIGLKEIEKAFQESEGFNILFLGYCGHIRSFTKPAVRIGGAACLHAYIVSRIGLKKLIQQPLDQNKPVDLKTKGFCEDELCFVSATRDATSYHNHGIIHQDEEAESNLAKDRKSIFKK
jgi:hypothetical protein